MLKLNIKKEWNRFINRLIVKPIDNTMYDAFGDIPLEPRELRTYLHIHFCNMLYAIYSKIPPLEWLLSSLCELEIQLKYIFNAEERAELDSLSPDDIPYDLCYCNCCPFADRSKLARFLFGYQSDGYCHYLKTGDFSFLRPTMLLWDGCKECGVNEYEEEDDDNNG